MSVSVTADSLTNFPTQFYFLFLAHGHAQYAAYCVRRSAYRMAFRSLMGGGEGCGVGPTGMRTRHADINCIHAAPLKRVPSCYRLHLDLQRCRTHRHGRSAAWTGEDPGTTEKTVQNGTAAHMENIRDQAEVLVSRYPTFRVHSLSLESGSSGRSCCDPEVRMMTDQRVPRKPDAPVPQ